MTDAELAVLTLVAERPRHGYEIERVIEERGVRDWTEIGFSSIYHVLKRLEAAELVASALEAAEGRGPARRVFRVTDAGRAAWREATLAALSEPAQRPPSLLQGLANLPGVDPDEAREALARYLERLDERRSYVEGRLEALGEVPDFVAAMFDYSLTMLAAERDWVARYRDRLGERER